MIRKTKSALPEYLPSWKFRSIIRSTFKYVFALLHEQKDEMSIFLNIDVARYSDRYLDRYSNRYSNRYSHIYMIRKTQSPFSHTSTWLDIHIDIQIDIQIGICTSTWSERRNQHFPGYRPGSIFNPIFKSVFALMHDQNDKTTIFPKFDLAR